MNGLIWAHSCALGASKNPYWSSYQDTSKHNPDTASAAWNKATHKLCKHGLFIVDQHQSLNYFQTDLRICQYTAIFNCISGTQSQIIRKDHIFMFK